MIYIYTTKSDDGERDVLMMTDWLTDWFLLNTLAA